jgi:hypothetical protein
MKIISPKLAASACLFAILAAPLTGLANPKPGKNNKKYPVAEPGTLAMTVAGLGLGTGLLLFGLRRNRKSVTA